MPGIILTIYTKIRIQDYFTLRDDFTSANADGFPLSLSDRKSPQVPGLFSVFWPI